MTVVVDTNVVLGAFSEGHPNRPIVEAWLTGELRWAVTTEILLEYEEILRQRSGSVRAEKAMQLIDVMMSVGFCQRVIPQFRWNVIRNDPDDDKFADCAIASEADFIITEDGHFAALNGLGFKPCAISPTAFIETVLGR